jgi:hypothetical protein
MNKINISDLIPAEAIYDDFFNSPSIRHRKEYFWEEAAPILAKITEKLVSSKIKDDSFQSLKPVLETHIFMYGEYDTTETTDNKDKWEAELDQAVELAIAPWEKGLSADWLGLNLVGTEIKTENDLHDFCLKLAKEYYKQLVHDNKTRKKKADAKILSNANIISVDFLARWQEFVSRDKTKALPTFDNVVIKIAKHLGMNFNVMQTLEFIDLALSDDDILSQGAANSLGITIEDLHALQGEQMVRGFELPDEIILACENYYKDEANIKAKKSLAKGKPRKPEELLVNSPDRLSLRVWDSLRLGTKDDNVASMLNISRTTVQSHGAGRTGFVPTKDQKDLIREVIRDKINAALLALAELDGTEPLAVE